MAIEFVDNKDEDSKILFIHHASLLLKTLHNHFKTYKQNFEFRIPPAFNEEVIEYLDKAYDKTEWKVTGNSPLYTLTMQ